MRYDVRTDSRGISEQRRSLFPRARSPPPLLSPALVSNDIPEHFRPVRFRFRMRDAPEYFTRPHVTSRRPRNYFPPADRTKVSSTPRAFFRIIENFRQSFKPLRKTTVLDRNYAASCSYRHEYCIVLATCSKSDSFVYCSAISRLCVGEKLESNRIRNYY